MGVHISPLDLNPSLAPDTMLDSAEDIVNDVFAALRLCEREVASSLLPFY